MGFYNKSNQFICPVETTLEILSGKWKGRILWKLTGKKMRFGELCKELDGITEKVLTQQLRQLQKANLIKRQSFAEVPPKTEYSLSELGETMKPIFMQIAEWGMANKEEIIEITEKNSRKKRLPT